MKQAVVLSSLLLAAAQAWCQAPTPQGEIKGQALAHTFTEPGRYTITVTDLAGRYDRVEVSVR